MPGRASNEGAGSVDSKAVVDGGTDNEDERWAGYCSEPFWNTSREVGGLPWWSSD